MAFWNACSGVLTVFAIGLLGYLLTRKGWIVPKTAASLPKFVTSIVLPPYLLRSTTSTFTHDQLLHLLSGVLIPFLSIFICFGLGVALTKILKVAPNRRGIFRTSIATSSTLNIGLPINIALFGESSLPYVLLYFFGNALFFWTVGNYSIAHDGASASVKLFSRDTVKKIFSPPLIGFACGIALVLLDVPLPSFLDKSFKYVGDMAIPLSIMYIGIVLSDITAAQCKFDRDVIVVFIGRFVISPLTVLGLSMIFPIPDVMRNVFIIQSSLPVMMNVAILAGYYKADVQYGTVTTSMSTVLALFTIPLYMVLIATFL